MCLLRFCFTVVYDWLAKLTSCQFHNQQETKPKRIVTCLCVISCVLKLLWSWIYNTQLKTMHSTLHSFASKVTGCSTLFQSFMLHYSKRSLIRELVCQLPWKPNRALIKIEVRFSNASAFLSPIKINGRKQNNKWYTSRLRHNQV